MLFVLLVYCLVFVGVLIIFVNSWLKLLGFIFCGVGRLFVMCMVMVVWILFLMFMKRYCVVIFEMIIGCGLNMLGLFGLINCGVLLNLVLFVVFLLIRFIIGVM